MTEGPYAFHAITFKGNALDFFMTIFLESLKSDPDDPNRKTEASALLNAAQPTDADYYMVVLPSDMVLDNNAISEDDNVIHHNFTRNDGKPPM